MSAEHHVEYAPPDHTSAPIDNRAWYGAMMLAALLALLPFLAVTGSGIAISPDSTQYLSAARNVIEGHGLIAHWWAGTAQPLTHFPPLYPFALAAVSTIIRADPLDAAWVVNLVLLVTNVMLVGLLATKASGGRLPIGAAAALATAVMVDVARAHAFALTEPLFITFALLTFAALARALEREDDVPTSRRALLSAAVLTGLAALTRYAGIVLIVVGVTALLLFSDARVRTRLRRAMMFGLVAALPLALWLVHNVVVGGSASNRELTVHPMTREQIERGMSTMFSWLAPYVTWQAPRFVVGVVLFAILTMAAAEVLRARHRFDLRRHGELPRVLVLFVALYGAFLVFSISFVDRQTELEPRILLPALFALVLLVVPTLARLGNEPGMPRSAMWSRIAPASLALFVLLSGAALVDWSRTGRKEGLGLQVTATRVAPMLASVAALPPNVRLYSNMPDVIHHFTGRVAIGLPRRVDPTSMRPNPRFDEQLATIDDAPVPTFVIYFRDSSDRWFVATDAEVETRVRLQPRASFPAGLMSEVETGSDSSHGAPRLP